MRLYASHDLKNPAMVENSMCLASLSRTSIHQKLSLSDSLDRMDQPCVQLYQKAELSTFQKFIPSTWSPNLLFVVLYSSKDSEFPQESLFKWHCLSILAARSTKDARLLRKFQSVLYL